MIGFGELRRIAAQQHADVTAIERVYAVEWMLKGIFDHAMLGQALVLRGGSALRYVYSAEFPIADDPEFLMTKNIGDNEMHDALTLGLTRAADASGLKFSFVSHERGGRIEYTGPLGRRSAAQPRVTISVIPGRTQLKPTRLPLVHTFSDDCAATAVAVALDELAAEQIAALARTPRARDVFNLWFVLTALRERIDAARVRNLVLEIAREKKMDLPRPDAPFDPKYRGTLERAWDNALRGIHGRPSFAQVEKETSDELKFIFAN